MVQFGSHPASQLAELICKSYSRGKSRQTKAVVQISLTRAKNTRKAREGPKKCPKKNNFIPENLVLFIVSLISTLYMSSLENPSYSS